MTEDSTVGKSPQPAFKTDFRKSNPNLHLLYTKWAVVHLQLIDRIQRRLEEESQGDVMEVQVVIREAREKLVATDAAFADAQEVLRFSNEVDRTTALRRENEEPEDDDAGPR